MGNKLSPEAANGDGLVVTLVERVIHRRRPLIVLAHAAIFALAYTLAFALRFDFRIPGEEFRHFVPALPWIVATQLAALGVFHLYEGLWRYVGIRDVLELVKATLTGSAVSALGIFLVLPGFPRSVIVLDWLLALGFAGGVRIFARVLLERSETNGNENGNRHRAPVLIAGAGDLAEALLREIARGKLPYRAVGLLDDNPRLRGRRLYGVRVLGRIDDLPLVAATTAPELVLIASPDADDKRRVAHTCQQLGLEVKAVPALPELLQGRAFIEQLRDVRLDELLGRRTNGDGSKTGDLHRHLHGRRVLITGAAGSIGSELARQIAAREPAHVVLLDRNESELYFTALELKERFLAVEIDARVGDITDAPLVGRLMREFTPEFVYHAAAYKHVPLMEAQPIEAVKNNVFGTEVVARAAVDAGVDRFVNVSTDKAVDPVSVMGMTKRAAESLVASLSGQGTTFVSVRFGNVLGSHGSILPIFHGQVARGVPITITDPDATRYFMLVSEAVELVLQAGRLGRDGEVYVLDMGEPVRIGDLADSLVRLAGLEPHIDVSIDVVGLRPGERLHEHAGVGNDEQAERSEHEHILVVRGAIPDEMFLRLRLNALRERFIAGDGVGCVESLRSLVAAAAADEGSARAFDEG